MDTQLKLLLRFLGKKVLREYLSSLGSPVATQARNLIHNGRRPQRRESHGLENDLASHRGIRLDEVERDEGRGATVFGVFPRCFSGSLGRHRTQDTVIMGSGGKWVGFVWQVRTFPRRIDGL